MKTLVAWHARRSPNNWEFKGSTPEGSSIEIGARSVEGGPKNGPSPKELVAMGIASCTGVDVVSTLQKMRQPLAALQISTSLTQTVENPRVFETCELTYNVNGEGLVTDRVVRAIELSFTKYCGVSAMIERSGCVFTPKLILNGKDVGLLALREGWHPEKIRIGILTTGNEVLLGKTHDTNGGFIAKHFEAMGFHVVAKVTCGDFESEILHSLRYLSENCEAVIMTGGLGPTSDDLTASVVAKFFKTECVFNEAAWNICVSAFKRLGRAEIPETNRKQAMLPRNSIVLDNPVGTAAGFCQEGLRNGRKLQIYALPGVPFEMEVMLKSFVLPRFVEHGAIFVTQAWQVFMLGESKLQATVSDIENELKQTFPDAHVSYQAHALSVTYSASLQAKTSDQAELFRNYLNGPFADGLKTRLNHHIAYQGTMPLTEFIQYQFVEKKLTLAFAESCTGGLVAKEISAMAGCSQYFLGAVVSYSNASKVALLGVDEKLIASQGAVSRAVACQMAAGACKQLASTVGVGITGVAGPDGGTEEKPVGLVCFAICFSHTVVSNRDKLVATLAPFGFTLENSIEPCYIFTCEQKFGGRMREHIQARASQFVLGILAASAKELGQ